MTIKQSAAWFCDGMGCHHAQNFPSERAALGAGWVKTKYNVFCPSCVEKFRDPVSDPTLSDLMDTHGKPGRGCPKCAAKDRRIEQLEQALRELVRLKDLKDSYHHLSAWKFLTDEEKDRATAARNDYEANQPRAWEAARRALPDKP